VQAIISAIGTVDEPRFGASDTQAEIKFCFPKKASKRKIISPPDRKIISPPDVDNLAKFVLDAVGKQLYEDDAQISRMVLEKTLSDSYGGKGYTTVIFSMV
jgi:Holliday junction resolvase RusA-like endonuclease